ncbi:MAG: PIN domain-containing protein [Polyangiaceae bacterium]|nr:PIN domain-containing protein [Polyangiaceae bacterium]
MRRALVDTDILSEIFRGRNETVRNRVAAYTSKTGKYAISTVTVMEVVKGLHRVGREAAIVQFLSELTALEVVPVDTAVGTLAGRIYADLERVGRPIGRADPLIAASALVHDSDLVTGNVAHYEAIRNLGYALVIENWRQPATQ